jgi:hypothetical protein
MPWRSSQSAASTPFDLHTLYVVEHGRETVGGSCLHGGCRKGGCMCTRVVQHRVVVDGGVPGAWRTTAIAVTRRWR